MDFLTQSLVFVLSSYLAFTNGIALRIESVLPDALSIETNKSEVIAQRQNNEVALVPRKLDSTYSENNSIPDILIKNAAYQKAAVVESIDPETAGASTLEALVNIYCSYTTDTYTKTTTGTGFFIDTDGIILTNAHVAQFLLLEGLVGNAECTIRTGNPAVAMYKADLLYIPPAWVRKNANLINDASPKGTGERDYALLYVTSGLNNKPMPSKFPALPFDIKPLTTGIVTSEVFATGYPAESILKTDISLPLIPKQATTSIAELMTFGSNLVDLFTIRGTSIGEHGSSGGPVVNKDGKAVGIISTKGDDASFGKGSLRAISLSYIDRTIKEETLYSLTQNLGGNLPRRAQIFKETIVPFLQKEIKGEL